MKENPDSLPHEDFMFRAECLECGWVYEDLVLYRVELAHQLHTKDTTHE